MLTKLVSLTTLDDFILFCFGLEVVVVSECPRWLENNSAGLVINSAPRWLNQEFEIKLDFSVGQIVVVLLMIKVRYFLEAKKKKKKTKIVLKTLVFE